MTLQLFLEYLLGYVGKLCSSIGDWNCDLFLL